MCDCRDAVNERLAGSNAKIAMGLLFGEAIIEQAPPMIALEKIDEKKRGKLPTLIATCCPFCGERYRQKALPKEEQDYLGERLPTPAEIELMMRDTEAHRAGPVCESDDGILRVYYSGFNLTALAAHISRELANPPLTSPERTP